MKSYFITALLLLVAAIVSAQKDFRPGYIITQTGDSLSGEIDYRGDLKMGQVCRFRMNAESPVTSYFPEEIQSFRFIDSKYYISKNVGDKIVFLEFLIKGKVCVFYMRDSIGDHFYIEKEGNPLEELPYKEWYTEVDGNQYLANTTIHRRLLARYMYDAPKTLKEIGSFKEPNHYSLMKLAENYHNEVCADEKCIIYEKVLPLLSVKCEALAGTIHFSKDAGLLNSNYFLTGVVAHFWAPRANEKIYFRTGLLYSTLQCTNDSVSCFRIPIQLEYIYPKGIVRPKFAIGATFCLIPLNNEAYLSPYWSHTLMGGANIRISKSVYLSLNSEVEFLPEPVIFISEKFLSYSFSGGVYFNF